jgi:Tfp pilus assembly protein PilO
MSDIVERLRQGETEGVDGWWSVMAEAANEIERLRAENENLRAAFRVNMLRAFSHMSHEEIDAEIAAAIRESVDE